MFHRQNYCNYLSRLNYFFITLLFVPILINFNLINHCYADCTFYVINNSNLDLYVEAGFYSNTIITSNKLNLKLGSPKSITFLVRHASNNAQTIKGSQNCTSTSQAGLGVAYLNLVSPVSKNSKKNNINNKTYIGVSHSDTEIDAVKYPFGGWIYAPQSQIIRAMGESLSNNDGALGFAPNGSKLFLMNNYKPDEYTFSVVIKQANRNTSAPGSMN